VPPAQLVTLSTSDGVAIVADHWPADSTLAYVVAHGFTGSGRARRVRRIASQLAERGATVLALDFRGHGRSGGHSTLGDVEVRDVAAAVAFLRAAGHARIALVGWSMGGSVVLRYAGLGGDADAVVSISSPGHWWERGTAPMRLVHWAAETRTGRLVTRLATGTRLRNFEWQQLPESPVEVVAAIAPRPLLIVHGDADRYFPLRHGEALAAAAGDAVFWTEAGMGHAESATTPALVGRVDAWVRQALDAAALRP
jgi:uncharacterized protein